MYQNMELRSYSTEVIYRRYLDDVLIICRSESAGCDETLHKNYIPLEEDAAALISVTMSQAKDSNIVFERTGDAWLNGESIEYLDLRLRVQWRKGKKYISTEVFDKPTNLHIYTDPSTWYPMHYVYNWIQGENIRLIRNSSSIESYSNSLDLFK